MIKQTVTQADLMLFSPSEKKPKSVLPTLYFYQPKKLKSLLAKIFGDALEKLPALRLGR